jgi:hypothetical protein
MDVDMLLRLQRTQHDAVLALLLKNGFRPGRHRYQFFKDSYVPQHERITSRLLKIQAASIWGPYFRKSLWW